MFAGSASALTGGNATLTAVDTTNVGVGQASQPAGPWTLTPDDGATWNAGDQVLIEVADNGDAGCDLEFSDVPSVSIDGTANVVATIESSAACGGTGETDVLRLNFTSAGTGTLTITSIEYNVESTAATGLVDVDVSIANGAGGTGTVAAVNAANAFVTTAIFSANNPPNGHRFGVGDQPISPFVVAEQTTDALDGDNVCFNIVSGESYDSDTDPDPTVSVSGNDTATVSYLDADSILMQVTGAGTANASTFTINGIQIDTDDDNDQVAVLMFTDTDGNCNTADGTIVILSADTLVTVVIDVDRFGGANRFATAQILFEDMFGCIDTAIIARHDVFADALAGNYLAGDLGTGILLTMPESIPSATLNALRNSGVETVYILGETEAVSAAVATQLDATPVGTDCGDPVGPADGTLDVIRIGGINRYETAQEVSEFPGLTNPGSVDGDLSTTDTCETAVTTAIIATGENFPDALAAGPFAYSGDFNCGGGELPLLLTQQESLPQPTEDALVNLSIDQVVVMGDTDAVSAAVVAEIEAMGIDTFRVGGEDRQATAIELFVLLAEGLGWDDDDAGFARGNDFADALTAGPWLGQAGDAMLLVQNATTVGANTSEFLVDHVTILGDFIDIFWIFGGGSAIADSTVDAAIDTASQAELD